MTTTLQKQITKFKLYGFFKNLRFFDPFLLLFLTYNQISVTEIGILWAFREAIIYVFEIPSGVIADQMGLKNELLICFVFYILSFVTFYFSTDFIHFIFAFSLYGLGEAFRSGTHKAMIMEFIEVHNLTESKSELYGSTRSFSMLGSMLSSILVILIVLIIQDLRILFLIAVVPYIIDLLLVFSYPDYLNVKAKDHISMKELYFKIINMIQKVFKDPSIRTLVIDSSSYGAIFKILKDYIQIIVFVLLAKYSLSGLLGDTEFILAVMYSVLFFFSAIASKYAYKILSILSKKQVLLVSWIILGSISVLFIFVSHIILMVGLIFTILYVIFNIRKPIMVDMFSEVADKDERASVLSVDSQVTSIFMIILAPVFGYVYDTYGIKAIFYVLTGISLIFVIIPHMKNKRA